MSDEMIFCPHCGQQFAISNAAYANILEQVKTQSFERELTVRSKAAVDAALLEERSKTQAEIAALRAELELHKDLKLRMSTKMVGETLEQHCLAEFNKIRALAFPTAYFEKDNDARSGSKGDFIFRQVDEETGEEVLSIMFEMKNEMDDTASSAKHKNEDFFAKLNSDRCAKHCQYAVLVSMLEQDSDYYNQGIVDVSHRYRDMYVIRPQFFLPFLSILYKNALAAFECHKRELRLHEAMRLKEQEQKSKSSECDALAEKLEQLVADSEKYHRDVQRRADDVGTHLSTSKTAIDKAVAGIDAAIQKLSKAREQLLSAGTQALKAEEIAAALGSMDNLAD